MAPLSRLLLQYSRISIPIGIATDGLVSVMCTILLTSTLERSFGNVASHIYTLPYWKGGCLQAARPGFWALAGGKEATDTRVR